MSDIHQRLRKRQRIDDNMDDMDTSLNSEAHTGIQPPVRRQFNELHPKDQNVKLNRKARIESNWGTEIQECVPPQIRPRMEFKKGAKARVGDVNVQEEVWWNWSVELLRGLEELSTLTAGNLTFAKELLTMEVGQRQAKPNNPQRKLVELLLGDVQRVNDGLRRSQAQMIRSGGSAEEYDTKDMLMGLVGEQESANNGEEDDDDDDYSEKEPTSPSRQEDTKEAFQVTPAKVSGNGAQSKAPVVPYMTSSPSVETPDRSHHVNVQHLAAGLQQLQSRARQLRGHANRLETEAIDLEQAAAKMKIQLDRV